MRFGSVCSGIEAASVAWHPLGWQAAWLSEIEPFPSAVLAHHYPDVPNLGDMTALPKRIRSGEVEAPDLFCGGTPCQAFSVAGLRKSLDDDRGNLSLTFCEIADAIDDVRRAAGQQPAIIFWENVPGVLNTKDNAFGCFLAGLAGESLPLLPAGGRWTNAGCVLGPQRAIAWRVLDAQHFGVAQRRRRVFVVASARDGFNPAEILFEFQGVRRDTAPSREAGEVTPTLTKECTGVSRTGHNEDGWYVTTLLEMHDTVGALCADSHPGAYSGQDAYTGRLIPTHYRKSRRAQSTTDHETWVEDDVSNILNCFGMGDIRSTDVVAQPMVAPTLTAGNDPSRSPQSSEVTNQVAAVHAASMAVRRLTPVECERLQGFPDNYTNIPWRKASESPDGPRYKVLGNSWAVPVVRWIGQRIQESVK